MSVETALSALFKSVREGTAADVDAAVSRATFSAPGSGGAAAGPGAAAGTCACCEAARRLVNARGPQGGAALHLAAWRGRGDVIHHLLRYGANPDAQDLESGWSALHKAAFFGRLAAAVSLLEGGASAGSPEDGSAARATPLDLLAALASEAAAGGGGKGVCGGPARPSLRPAPPSPASATKRGPNAPPSGAVFAWGSGVDYQARRGGMGGGGGSLHKDPCMGPSLA